MPPKNKFTNTFRTLAVIASPAWVSIFCAVLAVYIGGYFSPLSAADAGKLIFGLIIAPSVLSLIIGNIGLAKIIDGNVFAKLFFCFIYTFGALFIQFFAGWWVLMILGL